MQTRASLLLAAALSTALLVLHPAVARASGHMQTTTIILAQAGSTGGVIGKQDKSVSGEESAPPKRSSAPVKKRSSTAETGNRVHTHSAKKSATRCKLAATWRNQAPAGNSTWTITADGTATEQGMGFAQGHATLTDHELVINWRTLLASGRYVIELNRNCSGGTGKVIIGVYSGPAIFTAAPSQSN
jgi:hypothetical protein